MGENDNMGRGVTVGSSNADARLGSQFPTNPNAQMRTPMPPDIARALMELTNFCVSNKADINNNTQRIEIQTTRIDTEITERKAGEAALTEKISEEVAIERAAREQSEAGNFGQLKRWIEGEAETRKNAVDGIRSELGGEIETLGERTSTLLASIEAEKAERKSEISNVKGMCENVAAYVNEKTEELNCKVDEETAARVSAVNAAKSELKSDITSLGHEVGRNSGAINDIKESLAETKTYSEKIVGDEAEARQAADAQLSSQVGTVDTKVTNLTGRIAQTKTELQGEIAEEAQQRMLAIESAKEEIGVEISAVDGKASAAKTGLEALTATVNSKTTALSDSIETEAELRETKDEQLERSDTQIRNSVTELSNTVAADKEHLEGLIDEESTRREDAIADLRSAVNADLLDTKGRVTVAEGEIRGLNESVTKLGSDIEEGLETERQRAIAKEEQLSTKDAQLGQSLTELSDRVSANKSAFETAIANEEAARDIAISNATSPIEEDVEDLKTRMSGAEGRLTNLTARVTSLDTKVDDGLAEERTARESADTAHASAINSLGARLNIAEERIGQTATGCTEEIQNAVDGIKAIIDQKETEAKEEEEKLKERISANETAISELKPAVKGNSDAIDAEEEARETADKELADEITEFKSDYATKTKELADAIEAEKQERIHIDNNLEATIHNLGVEDLKTRVAKVENRCSALESTSKNHETRIAILEMSGGGGGGGGGDVTQEQLQAEIQARIDGDADTYENAKTDITSLETKLQGKIDAEKTAREELDTRLTNELATEAEERKAADERIELTVAEIRSTTEIVNAKTATEAKNFARQFAEELFSREKTEREAAVNAVYSFITNAVAAALIEAKAYADAHGGGGSGEVTKAMFEKEVEDRIKGDSNTYERAVNTAKAYTDSQIGGGGGGGGGDIDKDTPLPYLAMVGGDGHSYKQSVGIEDGEAVIKIDQITTVVDGQKTYNYVTLKGGDLKYYNLSVGIDESEVTQFLIETVNATDMSKALPYMTFLGSDGNKYKLSVVVEDSEPTLDLSLKEP